MHISSWMSTKTMNREHKSTHYPISGGKVGSQTRAFAG